MTATFDPYYKWLGIPPAEQPPNYYRLLGITVFESHPDVIESAADQRMVHLRSFQTGQHATASQKLLNEVAAAKLCLLRPDKKAAYDARLKSRVGQAMATLPQAVQPQVTRATAPQLATAAPLAAQSTPDWHAEAMQFAPVKPGRKLSSAAARRNASPPMALLVGGLVAGLLLVGGIFIALNNRQKDGDTPEANNAGPQVATVTAPHDKRPTVADTASQRTKASTTAASIKAVAQPAKTKPAAQTDEPVIKSPPDKATAPEESGTSTDPVLAGTGISAADLARRNQLKLPPDNPADKNSSKTAPAGDAAKPADATAKPADDPKPGDSAKPADGTKTADGENPDAAKPDDVKPEPRVAVPGDAAQQKALAEIKEILKDDYAQAKNAEGQLALAKKLQKLGQDTKNDAASRYVTHVQAIDFATKAGDPALAIDLIAALAKGFEMDVWDLRQKTITQLARAAKSPDVRATVARDAVDFAEQALLAGHFETAMVLSTTAMNLSASTKDAALRDQAREINERTKRLQREQPAVEAATEKLKASPDDPDANLVVGRFKCLLQDDWKAGLPYLAKAGDDVLKALAKLELADPTAADDQVKLADGWWDQSEKKGERKDDPLLKAAHNRAMYWYRLALPNLNGLNLAKVQKRIDADEAAKPEAPITETAYLDDLSEQNLTLANASLGKHGATGYERNFGNFGRGPGGGGGRGGRGGGLGQAAAALNALNTPQKVVLGGNEAKHALSLMPKSSGSATVSYNLDGKYRQFIGTAALMDGANPQVAVIFRVLADGKQIWTSKPMRRAGDAQECNLRIAKVQSLQFEILCNGANTGAHTVWINPAVGR